jgi:hypothetical protein
MAMSGKCRASGHGDPRPLEFTSIAVTAHTKDECNAFIDKWEQLVPPEMATMFRKDARTIIGTLLLNID